MFMPWYYINQGFWNFCFNPVSIFLTIFFLNVLILHKIWEKTVVCVVFQTTQQPIRDIIYFYRFLGIEFSLKKKKKRAGKTTMYQFHNMFSNTPCMIYCHIHIYIYILRYDGSANGTSRKSCGLLIQAVVFIVYERVNTTVIVIWLIIIVHHRV